MKSLDTQVEESRMNADNRLTRWQTVRTGLIEPIDAFQNDELDYMPYPASRSMTIQ